MRACSGGSALPRAQPMERARRPRLLPALSARGLLLRGLPASCSPPSLLSGLLASLLTSLPASFPPAWPPSALGLAGRAPSPKRVALAKSVEQPQRRQLRCFCVSKVKVSRCLLPLAGFKKKHTTFILQQTGLKGSIRILLRSHCLILVLAFSIADTSVWFSIAAKDLESLLQS